MSIFVMIHFSINSTNQVLQIFFSQVVKKEKMFVREMVDRHWSVKIRRQLDIITNLELLLLASDVEIKMFLVFMLMFQITLVGSKLNFPNLVSQQTETRFKLL